MIRIFAQWRLSCAARRRREHTERGECLACDAGYECAEEARLTSRCTFWRKVGTWYLLDTIDSKYKWSYPYWFELHEIEPVEVQP